MLSSRDKLHLDNWFFGQQFLVQRNAMFASREVQPVVSRISKSKCVLQTHTHLVQLTVVRRWEDIGTAKEISCLAFFEDVLTVQVCKQNAEQTKRHKSDTAR